MFDVYPRLPHMHSILNTITMVDKLNTPLSVPNYVVFSLSHAVAHVTLSHVSIAVPESAGMVTIQVTRSGDITGPSHVYFNTRPTATTPATGTGS